MESNNKISRKKLYQIIWATPITKLAKKHGIPADAIRNICKKLEIPTPSSGYWSKLKFNKPVEIQPLPKIKNDNQESNIEIIEGKWVLKEHFQTVFYRIKKEIETNYILPSKTPKKLIKPHVLIRAAKTDLKTKKPSKHIYSKIEHPVSTSKEIINIEVSKSNIHKALCFMDGFIKLLQKRKHSIEINGYHTEVIIFEERITIRCREILKRIKVKDEDSHFNWEHTELVPSGIIAFEMGRSYWKREWRESEKKPLETKLSNIIASLELKAKKQIEERIEREKWKIENEKRLKIEKQKQKRLELEIASFKELKEKAKQYNQAVGIRNYIQAVEENALKNNQLSDELQTWIQWASNKADWLDPIINKYDKYFSNLD